MDCQSGIGQTERLKLHCLWEAVTGSFQSLSQDGSINFTPRTQVDPAEQENRFRMGGLRDVNIYTLGFWQQTHGFSFVDEWWLLTPAQNSLTQMHQPI